MCTAMIMTWCKPLKTKKLILMKNSFSTLCGALIVAAKTPK